MLWYGRYPAWGLAIGALCVSASAVVIGLSGASPGTASFYRCALALPVLAVLAERERREHGGPSRGRRIQAYLAGALFAGDMLLWTQAIAEVGAGLSTVLVNVQVLIVPTLALLVDREPIARRFWYLLPVLLLGVVLTGGVLEHGAAGGNALAGTVHAVLAAVCYSGFLFLLRRGGRTGQVRQAYRDVTLSAALVALPAGALWHGIDLTPGWATIGWMALVALTGQILGWLLVALTTPHLPSHLGAVLLLLTPVGALTLGAIILGERPTPLQLTGCALILLGAYTATTTRRPRTRSST